MLSSANPAGSSLSMGISLFCSSGSTMSANVFNSPSAAGHSFFFAGARLLRTPAGCFPPVLVALFLVGFVGVTAGASGVRVSRVGASISEDVSRSDRLGNPSPEFKGEDSRDDDDDDGEADGDGDISVSARDISGSIRLIASL